jgi:hypothetical protein
VKGSPKPVEYTRAGWRVNPWADAVGISRSQVYEFIKAGMVRTVNRWLADYCDASRPIPRRTGKGRLMPVNIANLRPSAA